MFNARALCVSGEPAALRMKKRRPRFFTCAGYIINEKGRQGELESLPKYQRIYKHFVQKIESGELTDGQQLPTEEELCDIFHVSRVTVRNALKELSYQGYITKKHSRGSFVRAGVSSMCLDSLQGFTEEMGRRGLSVKTQVLRANLESAGILAASRLDIDERSKVYVIERLRFVEDEPMALERVILPFFRCPELLRYDLTGSLYEILEQEYGLHPLQATEALEATLAEKKEGDLLGIRQKSAVLRVERTSYISNHAPLEYALSIYRGDKYKFFATLNR